MSRVVLGQQELTFERHVARQLARRCRRLQREAVVAREATHSKALLQRHLAEAARDRRKIMDKCVSCTGAPAAWVVSTMPRRWLCRGLCPTFTRAGTRLHLARLPRRSSSPLTRVHTLTRRLAHPVLRLTSLQKQLADTQRRYDNEVVRHMGAQKSFDHEMERVDSLNARLAQDVRVARTHAQQADANASHLRLQNMELQAQLLMHRNEAERLQGSEAEAARAAEEVRQWAWTYSRHIRPRLLQRDHDRILQELGTAAYALAPSRDGSSDVLTADDATGRGGLTSLRGSLSPGLFTLSSGERTAPGTGSSGAFGSHGTVQGTSAGNGAGGTTGIVSGAAGGGGEHKGAEGGGDGPDVAAEAADPSTVHVPGDWPEPASSSARGSGAAVARLEARVQELEAQVEEQAATIAALETSRLELNEKWGKRMQLVEHK